MTGTGPFSFDPAEARRQADDEEDLLREIIGLFLQDLPKREADLRTAVERRDAKLLERTAHSIKGSCLTFGAAPARDAALAVELLGRSGRFDDAAGALVKLSEETRRLALDLKRFLDAPPA